MRDSVILHLLVGYRTNIDRNLLWLLEGGLVYYESISTVAKHIH